MNRIDELFARKRREGRKALIVYLTAGYPDMASSVEIAVAVAQAGADLIEFGIPFSDPIADGPTIQKSSASALQRGATLPAALDAAADFRKRTETPMILFGAYNPIFRFGLENIVKKALEIGIDGFLVPDLPIEEADGMEALCRRDGLAMSFLLAPTSPLERRREISRRSTGFVYYISLRGVTGARRALPEDLGQQLAGIRELTDKPIAVGFGISTPEQVREGAQFADAVVVGSALVDEIAKHEGRPDMVEKVAAFVKSLAAALR